MRFAFDGFEIDAEGCRLLRDGREVALERKAFDLLRYFAEHPERLITKEELLHEVWRARALSDGVLSNSVAKLRRALGQKAHESTPIETVRGRGYRFRARARTPSRDEARPARGLEPVVSADETDPFIGRTHLMDTLHRRLERACAGSGGLVLLTGEAGMGKTRTAQQLAARARGIGASVWVGAAYEGDGAPPYWPWIQVLRAALAEPGLDDYVLSAPLGLAQLASERGVPRSTEREPQAARFQLFDELTQFLKRASAEAPRVVVLDDLHWADLDTIELLGFAARGLQEHKVLLLATLRDRELPLDPDRHARIDQLERVATRVSLSGLSLDEVSQLARALSAAAPFDATFAQELHARSQGNPFFVRQMLDLLAQRAAEGEPRAQRLELPPAARDVIRRRLALLGHGVCRVLGAAAVIGKDFDAAVLAQVLDVTPETVLGELEPALRIGALHRRADSTLGFAFAHALLRDTLYEDLPLSERGALHRRSADVLSLRHGDNPRHLGEIAHHHLQSLPSDLAQVTTYCRKAAAHAQEASAFDAAAHLLAQAVAKLEAEAGGAQARCELLLELGANQLYLGRPDRAWRAFCDAAEAARWLERADLLARIAPHLADCVEVGTGDAAFARATVEQALALLPEGEVALRASLLAHRAELGLELGAGERTALLDRAAAMAEASGSAAAVLDVAHSRAILRDPTQLAANAAAADRFIELTALHPRAAADMRYRSLRRFEAQLTHYLCALTACDLDAADAALARCREIGAASHVQAIAILVQLMQTGRALGDARLEDVGRAVAELVEAARGNDATGLSDAALAFFVALVEAQGKLDTIASVQPPEPPPGELDMPSRRGLQLAIGRARFYALTARPEPARRLLAQLHERELARLPVHYGDLGMLCLLSDTYHLLGDSAGAQRLYDQLGPHAERNAVLPHFQYLGAVAHRLGLLARMLGRGDEARAHLELALQLNRKLRMPMQIAESERALRRDGA